jgi:hypothetical protein
MAVTQAHYAAMDIVLSDIPLEYKGAFFDTLIGFIYLENPEPEEVDLLVSTMMVRLFDHLGIEV